MPPPKKKKARTTPKKKAKRGPNVPTEAPSATNVTTTTTNVTTTNITNITTTTTNVTTTNVTTHVTNIYGYHELTQTNPAKDFSNPLSTSQTFAEALRVTDSARDQLRRLLPVLPKRGAAMYRPTTLSEATSYVNAREDAKKKQGVARLDGDVVAVPAESYRGSHPGVAEGDGEAAAFWLYTGDFFRDFCVEDAVELLAFLKGAEALDEFRLAELRARPPEILLRRAGVESREATVGLLDRPVGPMPTKRRQRRDSQKRKGEYVFSMGSFSMPSETEEASAFDFSVGEVTAGEKSAGPTTLEAPKARLQKLGRALGALQKILGAGYVYYYNYLRKRSTGRQAYKTHSPRARSPAAPDTTTQKNNNKKKKNTHNNNNTRGRTSSSTRRRSRITSFTRRPSRTISTHRARSPRRTWPTSSSTQKRSPKKSIGSSISRATCPTSRRSR